MTSVEPGSKKQTVFRDLENTMRTWAVLCSFLLTGCVSTVALDYQDGAPFPEYQSYAFAGSDAGADEVRSIDGARIEQAVDRELQGKLDKVDADTADLLVRYRVDDSVRIETTGFGYGFGFGRDRLGIGVATVPDAREVKEGKLVVELVERESRQMIWRAVGQRNLTEQMKPASREALINRLVKDMFERFPP